MRVTKDQIIGVLPTLTKDDLFAIKAVADSLLGGEKVKTKSDDPAGWLHDAMLRALGITKSFHNEKISKLFDKNSVVFLEFVNKHFEGSLKKQASGVAVMQALVKLIISDLKLRGVLVTYGSLATNLQRINDIFDAAFPGYLAAGLAGMIIVK